ncbi:hypothetical protein [Lunatimonas salinarum]|nr:hypothetical protein [Lunatimonas salinarum]
MNNREIHCLSVRGLGVGFPFTYSTIASVFFSAHLILPFVLSLSQP